MDIPMEDVETESSNATESETPESGLEKMTLKAQLKPARVFGDSGYYDVKKFGFVTSNGSEICPSNNCKFGVEEGQLSPYGAGYTFEGKLKVTTQDEETKKTTFYNFRFEFDKIAEEETDGEKIQTLDGRYGIGSQLTHDITNATLLVDEKNPILTFQGERVPSENFTKN